MTPVVVYIAGRELFDRRVGWIAAVVMCLVPLHVEHSHYATVDVPLTFFTMVAVMFLSFAGKKAGVRLLVFSAIAVGLAASVKYTGIFYCIPLLGWVLFGEKNRGLHGRSMLVFGLGMVIVAAFIAGSPYIVSDWQAFVRDFADQAQHSREGHLGFESPAFSYLLFNERNSLRGDTDIVTLALCLTGVGYGLFASIRERSAKHALNIGFVILLYAFLSLWQAKFVRWVIPLIPVMLVYGAAAISSLSRRFPPAVAVSLLCVALLLGPARSMTAKLRDLSALDTRTVATDWARKNIPRGASICMNPYSVYVDDRFWYSRTLDTSFSGVYAITDNLSAYDRSDYTITSSYYRERYSYAQTIMLRPALSQAMLSLYDSVERREQRVATFTPSEELAGPEIAIFRRRQ
jgi:4-amino-4-deoxy-L-arabinose transferase-like glycosyltransferase